VLAPCWFASLAHAQSGPPKRAANPACKSGLAETYPLPATLPKEALIRDIPRGPLLQSDTEIEIVCGVFGRQWKSQRTPSHLVFLETSIFRRSASESTQPLATKLRSALYRQDLDGQYRLVAASAQSFALPQGRRLDDLDLAPYRLTGDEYAFGVRTSEDFTGCEGSYCYGSSAFLDVFRVDGKAIRPILSTLLWSEALSTGPVNDNGARDEETLGDRTPARISVLKTRTQGMFDWKKSKGKDAATFKWNGEQYQTEDEDPVIDRSQ